MTMILFLVLSFGPLILLTDIDILWFNLLGMNLSLHSHDLTANLLQKIRATSQLCRFYFFVILLTVPLVVLFLRQLKSLLFKPLLTKIFSPVGMLWLMTTSLIAVHSIAKIYQVSYQTIIMPLLICLLSVEWVKIYRETTVQTKKLLASGLMAGCLLTLLSYGRTSISLINGKPAMAVLAEQARFVRDNSKPGDQIFSADSALVPVEAGRSVLPGMAGSDLFPDWPTQKCLKYNVLNFELMKKYVCSRKAPILIHGDRSFSLSLPYLEPINPEVREDFLNEIKREYKLVKTYPNLFIPGTSTYYYVLKEL